jgi:hypothetical protein
MFTEPLIRCINCHTGQLTAAMVTEADPAPGQQLAPHLPDRST